MMAASLLDFNTFITLMINKDYSFRAIAEYFSFEYDQLIKLFKGFKVFFLLMVNA